MFPMLSENCLNLMAYALKSTINNTRGTEERRVFHENLKIVHIPDKCTDSMSLKL